MEEYYLVARNKENNTLETIPIKEKWYLGKNGQDIFKRRNHLEAIDLTTTRFKNKEEMLNQMYKSGYIKTTNVDIFIAKKIKRNNKEYIKFHEVIYNPEGKLRITDLRKIAYSFLAADKTKEKDLIDKVFNKLIAKANSDIEFRNILTCEMTNVPKRLTDFFWKGTQSYSLKYKNLSAFENYSTIRSIIEALNRYDFLQTIPGNPFNNNVDYLNDFSSARKKVEPELLKILDKDYIPGQYDLFTYQEKLPPQENLSPQENTPQTEEKLQKTSLETSYQEDSETNFLMNLPSLPKEDQKKIILNTFSKIPFGLLNFTNNKKSLDSSFLKREISSSTKEQLETLLPNELFRELVLYTVHKNEYQKNLMYGANTNLLEEEIRQDEKTLSKLLAKEKNLDKIFLWTLIYQNTLQSDKKNADTKEKGHLH